jgi:pseudouridine 5'-phosphatase
MRRLYTSPLRRGKPLRCKQHTQNERLGRVRRANKGEMPPSLTHAIFDLDGTLLDSEPLYGLAATRVCARYGATFTLELKRAITGGDTLTGAKLVVETLALPLTPEAYIAERARELSLLWPTVEPMPHAIAVLDALEAHAIPSALATSGHRRITEEKLAHQARIASIAVRVCGDDARLLRGKPAPDIFLLAARDLEAAPERCVVFEDSVLGVRAGLAAGMYTIAVVDARYGFTRAMFEGAHQVVDSLADVDLAPLLGG